MYSEAGPIVVFFGFVFAFLLVFSVYAYPVVPGLISCFVVLQWITAAFLATIIIFGLMRQLPDFLPKAINRLINEPYYDGIGFVAQPRTIKRALLCTVIAILGIALADNTMLFFASAWHVRFAPWHLATISLPNRFISDVQLSLRLAADGYGGFFESVGHAITNPHDPGHGHPVIFDHPLKIEAPSPAAVIPAPTPVARWPFEFALNVLVGTISGIFSTLAVRLFFHD